MQYRCVLWKEVKLVLFIVLSWISAVDQQCRKLKMTYWLPGVSILDQRRSEALLCQDSSFSPFRQICPLLPPAVVAGHPIFCLPIQRMHKMLRHMNTLRQYTGSREINFERPRSLCFCRLAARNLLNHFTRILQRDDMARIPTSKQHKEWNISLGFGVNGSSLTGKRRTTELEATMTSFASKARSGDRGATCTKAVLVTWNLEPRQRTSDSTASWKVNLTGNIGLTVRAGFRLANSNQIGADKDRGSARRGHHKSSGFSKSSWQAKSCGQAGRSALPILSMLHNWT